MRDFLPERLNPSPAASPGRFGPVGDALCGAGGLWLWRRSSSGAGCLLPLLVALCGPVAASAAVSMLGAAALFLHG
ncbi:MAG: hypothetical protein P3W90_006020, partial [Paracoccus sp. (in: a-proteobacteria)]|nr:hypothetical protein [Paracoccus sp. (in: a-proteobacteria)]